MSSSEKIRVGVIGAGTNTKLKHIPGLQAIDGVSVDVVCNRSKESSQKAADAFGIPRIASDWEAVVADDSIDAICIGTWPYLHAEISIAALRAGKHVLTEARMAMNAAEGQAMIDASSERPQLVAQIVPSPFTLKWDATIKAILEAGELGDLREIRSIKTLPMNVDSSAPLSWRQDIEYSGNNAMMLGIYYEVVQRWIRRQPSRVWAFGQIFSESRFDPETGSDKSVRIPESLSYTAVYDDGLQLTGLMTGMNWEADAMNMRFADRRERLGSIYKPELSFKHSLAKPKPSSIRRAKPSEVGT